MLPTFAFVAAALMSDGGVRKVGANMCNKIGFSVSSNADPLKVVSLSLIVLVVSLGIALSHLEPSTYKPPKSATQNLARSFTKMADDQAAQAKRPIAGARRVMLFGATGMLGQGALREALLDPEVEEVVTVGRRKTGVEHTKLKEIEHADFLNWDSLETEFKNVDAVWYSLGVSSSQASGKKYEMITRDFTIAAARTLERLNPNMTFLFVSGEGTDRDSSTHWARIKAETEDAILAMPFHGYIIRPAAIVAKNGETSSTPAYRIMYTVLSPLITPLKWLLPNYFSTTEILGRAWLKLAREGSDTKVFNTKAVNDFMKDPVKPL